MTTSISATNVVASIFVTSFALAACGGPVEEFEEDFGAVQAGQGEGEASGSFICDEDGDSDEPEEDNDADTDDDADTETCPSVTAAVLNALREVFCSIQESISQLGTDIFDDTVVKLACDKYKGRRFKYIACKVAAPKIARKEIKNLCDLIKEQVKGALEEEANDGGGDDGAPPPDEGGNGGGPAGGSSGTGGAGGSSG